MKEKFFSVFLMLCFAFSLQAQTNKASSFTIKGQVVDSLTNESVPFATLRIVLAKSPQDVIKLLACDVDGMFETSLTAPGQYVIQMQSVGKSPAEKHFALSGSNSKVDLGELYMADDSQSLGEVMVVAQKPLVKVEIDKLTYSLEDDPEAKTNNTLDMLRKVPMVTVDGDEKIQLKGSDNFKIYLNGKPSNMLSSSNASDVLKGMPAGSVKNIEVITEPGAKYDAEGVGGIINIITTKNALQGYNASIRMEGSALGRYGAGGNISLKTGKLGLTANYNYRRQNNPWSDSESYRETKGDEPEYLSQIGRSKRKGPFQFGSLEASYELDSLNLLTVGANLFNGKMTNISEYDVTMQNIIYPEAGYTYERYSKGENTFGSVDVNVDFQHSTKKKDELLTFSYRFSNSPDDSESYTELKNEKNYFDAHNYPRREKNDAYTNEHTVQVDYTTPTFQDQTLEVGAKYILRQSNSEAHTHQFNDSIGKWEENLFLLSDFKHMQHIYSGYVGYGLKYKKMGYKVGIRAEGTSLNVKFKNDPEQNFKTDYFDVVPNATVSYMIDMAQQIRIGYNMRIQRPGIWYLNPYIDTSDPQNISYGNPNLDSEKSHNINMNYSLFSPKFNLNISANYTFVNNAIQRYTFVDEASGIYHSTYGNLGERQSVGSYIYGRWSPIPLFNLTLNGGVSYMNYKAKELGQKNDGVRGNVYSNVQVNLPKDFRVNVYGGYYSPWIMLQGKGSSHYFTGINVNKDFMDKKLSVTLSCNSPFWKTMKMENNTSDENFRMKNINHWRARDFSIRVSYRFGNLKDSIKKVKRGINNDDMRGGENNEGGQGGNI